MRSKIQLLRLGSPETKESSDKGKSKAPEADGELFLDGAFVGSTPATLRLSPGKHTLRVSSGFVDEPAKEVTIMSAVGLKLEARLHSILLGWNEAGSSGTQTADWPHKRLMYRHVGPFTANLYYGISDLPEEVLIRDFSERGVYFWSCRRMPIGGNVEICMEPPCESTQNGGRTMRYRATVLRVEEAAGDKFGTAALIKSCTPEQFTADQPARTVRPSSTRCATRSESRVHVPRRS